MGASDGQGRVDVERDGAIGTIVFDHQARRNAITLDMWRAIPLACAELDADDDIRVVVLRGAGTEAFVAGADISEFDTLRPGSADYDHLTEEAFRSVAAVGKPVVASIHGFCVGGGMALAVSADIRYAADDARFGVPPARLGLGYSAEGTGALVDLLGPAITKEVLYTAGLFESATALRWGLVNDVVAKAALDDYVTERARMIAERAPLSHRATKLAVADHLRPAGQRKPDEVAAAIAACAESDDYAEGIQAFLEKRLPSFKGS